MMKEDGSQDQRISPAEGRRKRGQRLTEQELKTAMEFFPGKDMLGGLRDREFFVGQEGPRKQLVDIITKSPAGTVVIISEPLGAGKSALIVKVQEDLIKNGHATHEECLRTNLFRHDLSQNTSFSDFYWSGLVGQKKPENWQEIKPKVIFIEEFDRKFRSPEEAMRAVGRFVKEGDVPIVVLSGDYELKDPNLIELLDFSREPVHVSLDPITPEMLKRTLELRLRFALGGKPDKIDMDALFEPNFFKYLIPNTNPQVATMRSSLVILQNMADMLGRDPKKPAGFSWDSYRKHSLKVRAHWESKPDVWHFVSRLHGLLHDGGNPRIPMRPMSADDLYSIGVKKLDIPSEEFQKLIKNLANQGFLISVGTPTMRGEGDKSPELYLPSQETFLDAISDPLPEKTPIEMEMDKQAETRRETLARLRSLYRDGIIEEAVFLQKRNQLVGIDVLIDTFVDGGIDKDALLAEKQKLLDMWGEN